MMNYCIELVSDSFQVTPEEVKWVLVKGEQKTIIDVTLRPGHAVSLTPQG